MPATLLKRVLPTALLCGTAAVSGFPQPADARVITVAKDGSGEFSVIQDALNAAQPGDIIDVAPGLYDDVRLVQYPLGTWYVAMRPLTSNLTIQGQGADQTIIGFAVSTPSVDGSPTSVLGVPESTTGLRFSGIRFQNVGQIANLAASARFADCAFVGPTEYAVALLDVDGTSFTNCTFEGSGNGVDFILGFVGGINPNTVIRGCAFSGDVLIAVHLTGASSAVVESCSFSGMRTGLQLGGATAGTIRNCTFDGIRNQNVVVEDDSDVQLDGCTLGPCVLSTLVVETGSRVVGTQNRLFGSGNRTLRTIGAVDISLTQGDLLNGGRLTVEVLSPQLYAPRIDLSNNYWGTTDLDQIAAWIKDGNDPPPPGCSYCPAAVVTYAPILGGTVPTEESTFGGLKARYGGE